MQQKEKLLLHLKIQGRHPGRDLIDRRTGRFTEKQELFVAVIITEGGGEKQSTYRLKPLTTGG